MTTRNYSQIAINYIVDAFHVSASEEEIRAEITRRIKRASKLLPWPPVQVRMAIQDAVKRHRANRALYAYVMRGGK